MIDYKLLYIITTPMIVFAIFLLFRAFLGSETHSKRLELFSYIAYFLLSAAMIFVTRAQPVMLIFNVAAFFLISLSYKAPLYKKALYSVLIYSVIFAVDAVVTALIAFLNPVALRANNALRAVVILISVRTATLIVAYVVSRVKKSAKKQLAVHPIYYLAVIIILFETLFLFTTMIDRTSPDMQSITLSAVILIVVNVTMILTDEKICNSIIAINEKNTLRQQNIAYENQAEIINQSTETIRALKHDMKNHLIMLSEMYANGKKDEIEPYIQKILTQMENGSLSHSGNFVIDSIVNFKLGKLSEAEADISVSVTVPQVLNILAYDLTVILGNLLDNTVAAVAETENKKIDLQISCSKGNLIILLDNSFNGNLIIENGRFKTTKSFGANHGLGLLNVEKALESYGGEITTEYTSATFSAAVIIPYEN